MSASKHKKERQERYASGEIERNPEQTAKKAAARRITITSIAALAVAFVVIAVAVLTTTPFLQRHTTAVKVGSHSISPAMFNFYYWTEYYDVCESYGDSLPDYINTALPLSQQYQDAAHATTWADYITAKAIAKIQEIYSVYDSAQAAGYQLSEEETASYNPLSETIDSAATSAGFETADDFIVSLYGKGCTKELYLQYELINHISTSYAKNYINSITLSQQDIEAYYDEHRDSIDTVSYRLYNCTVKKDDPTLTGPDAVDTAASQAMAQDMAELSFGSEETFLKLTVDNSSDDKKELYSDPDTTLIENAQYANVISDELRSWLSDSARKPGDTTYLASSDGSYNVFYFVERNTKDYPLVNLRDIHFAYTVDTENSLSSVYGEKAGTVYTSESMESAKTLSEKAMNNFLLTDRSEDSFIELVKTYSEDPADANTFGLNENYQKGTLSPEVDAWAYDASRKAGDYITVKSDDGYYMLYFSGYGENCRTFTISNALRQERYEQWYSSSTSALDAQAKSGMRYTNRDSQSQPAS